MIRKLLIILGISILHFALVQLVTYLGISATGADFYADGSLSLWASALVLISRVLHFPIITLALFSRARFPGNLIYIPMFLNSLLWGIGIYLIYVSFLKLRRR